MIKTPSPAALAELKSLIKRGFISPEVIVRRARRETSALHAEFNWDDTSAAHQHRLNQARALLRFSVILQDDGKSKQYMPVYVSLFPDRTQERGYRELVTVLADSTLRGDFLQLAFSTLRAFKAKFASLTELRGVFDAIDTVLATPTRPPSRGPAKIDTGQKSKSVA
jgi:hypothetical protein